MENENLFPKQLMVVFIGFGVLTGFQVGRLILITEFQDHRLSIKDLVRKYNAFSYPLLLIQIFIELVCLFPPLKSIFLFCAGLPAIIVDFIDIFNERLNMKILTAVCELNHIKLFGIIKLIDFAFSFFISLILFLLDLKSQP